MKGVKGEIVAGRYRVGDQVGTGGFGTVYAGRQMNLERDVAIKVMRKGPEGAAVSRERFRREAVLSSSFSHPNIVTYHDFLIDDDGDMILVMEFLRGVTLDRILARDGRMEVGRAARIVAGVAEGLAECHRAGIVHRDIKPSNIFILEEGTSRERAKIIDFGILWTMPDLADGMPDLTRENAFIGTPEYVAPEVLIGAYPDGRTDQYALALVALRAMTGEMPFPDSKGRAILDRLARRPAALDSASLAGCPAVRGVLYKALSPEPGDRFGDMDVFGRAMCASAGVNSGQAQSPVPGAFTMQGACGDDTIVESRKSLSGDPDRMDRATGRAAAGGADDGGVPVAARTKADPAFRKTVAAATAVTLCMCFAIGVVAYVALARGGAQGVSGAAGVNAPPAATAAVAETTTVTTVPRPVVQQNALVAPVPAAIPATGHEQADRGAAVVPAGVDAPVKDESKQTAGTNVKPSRPSRQAVVRAAPKTSATRTTRQSAVQSVQTATPSAPPVTVAPAAAVAAPPPVAGSPAPVAGPADVQGDGFLVLNPQPWSYLRIDGVDSGTSSHHPIKVSAGRHTVEFYRKGFTTIVRTFDVAPGQTLRPQIDLTE